MFVIIITFLHVFIYLFIYFICIFVALDRWVLAYAFNELDLGFKFCNKFSTIINLTIFVLKLFSE